MNKLQVYYVEVTKADQNTTYEDLIKIKDVEIYDLPQFFQAFNDELISDQNWTFLVDINRKEIINTQ